MRLTNYCKKNKTGLLKLLSESNASTPTRVQPERCTKKKATENNQAKLGQEQETTVMEIQTSDEHTISCEKSISHLSDKFQEMKSKIDVKKLELDVANKQRMIDKLLQQVKVQIEGAESLTSGRSSASLSRTNSLDRSSS